MRGHRRMTDQRMGSVGRIVDAGFTEATIVKDGRRHRVRLVPKLVPVLMAIRTTDNNRVMRLFGDQTWPGVHSDQTWTIPGLDDVLPQRSTRWDVDAQVSAIHCFMDDGR